MPLIMPRSSEPLATQNPNSQPPATTITPTIQPTSLSIPLPFSPHTTLHLQVTPLATSTLVFITTTDPSTSSSLSALGSFVYAMPNRFQPTEPLSTALYEVPGSIEFATRMAKILVRRTGIPIYVGCSAVFGGIGIEEEMAGVKGAVDGVIGVLKEKRDEAT